MRYSPIRELGAGGMAVVTLARDDAGALVVLKRTISRKPSDEKRLRDEGRIGKRLKHPAIVQTLDMFDEQDGRPVLVLEYVPGLSMAALRANGPLPAGLCCVVGHHVAAALAAIHAAKDERGSPLNILHRDVTPANILVSLDGQPKLIDLGIARAADSLATKTATGEVRGTLRYLAPELFNDQKQSTKSDLWALGVVVLEAALGRPLYSGSTHEILTQILRGPPLGGDTLSQLNPVLAQAVRPLLEPQIDRREGDAAAAAAAFATAMEALGASRDDLAHHVQAACTTPLGRGGEDEESWSSLLDAREALTAAATPAAGLPIITRRKPNVRLGVLAGAAITVLTASVALTILNQIDEDAPLVDAGSENPEYERTVLVPFGSTWRYDDSGLASTMDFRKPDFDDSAWKSGAAPLGYGGDGEATLLSFGDDPNRKHASALFRRWLEVADPSGFEKLELRVRYDDGVALVINGVIVLYKGLQPNSWPYQYATGLREPDAGERAPVTLVVDNPLHPGRNLIVADVHQNHPRSSDLSFDLEIVGLREKKK